MNRFSPVLLPSIRKYLLVRVIGIVLLGFAIFGIAVYTIVVRPAEDTLAQVEMAGAADKVDAHVRALTSQIEGLLVVAREWGVDRRIHIDDRDGYVGLMVPLMRARPQILNVLFADESGKAMFVGREEAGSWLARSLDPRNMGRLQHWVRYDAQGAEAESGQFERDYDPRTRPWFKGAMALAGDGALYWTEPYKFDLSGQPGITAAVRWTDRRTGQRYVLAFDVLLLDLSRFTSNIELSKRGRAAVLTADGRMLATPRDPRLTSDAGALRQMLKTPREAGLPVFAAAFKQWEASGRPTAHPAIFEAEGDTWIARFRPFELRNQQLLVGTFSPRSDFANSTAWQAAVIALLAVVMIGIASLVARRFAATFSGTVEALVRESERIGSLDLDRPVSVEAASHEFALLVAAQERMRRMLLEAKHGLETKVEERTAQLAEREAYSRALMDSSPAGLVLAGRDGVVRDISTRGTEIVGYTLEELHGVATDRLYADPEERSRFLDILGRDAEVRNFETRFLRRDGTEFWGLLNASGVTIGGEPLIASWIQDVTEQHAMNERIRALATEHELLLNNVQTGILFTGDGRMLRANPKFAELFGFAHPDDVASAQTSSLFADEEEFGRFAAAAGPVLAAGETLSIEWQAARLDGTRFMAHTQARPIQATGYRFATIWIVEDISERKAAERALRSALDRQNAIFATSPYGITMTEQRRFVLASPSFERMFGYAPGEVIGQSARIVLATQEEFDRIGRDIYPATARGETYTYESRMVRKDGSLFWCRSSLAALAGGDPMNGLMTIYEDVTEEHEAADALRLANEEQHAILESATLGIALIKDRRIFNCNARLCELFGYTAGEFIGQSTRLWYPDDEAHAAGGDPAVYEPIARGLTHRREQLLQHRDGSLFWCRLSGRAIDPDDLSKGSVWMLEDVTDEREFAEALRQAKEIAEEATHSKSMFLANMSHEIRTPMNAIIGMAYLALRTNLDAKQRDYVQKIHNAGTSLLGIINDILDFSKIEAGKLDMESVGFVLDDVLENLSTLVGQKVFDKGLELVFDVAPDVPQNLVGDPLRLGQILVNLVNNAVKFTDTGEIHLRVEQQEVTGGRTKIAFSVRDTGIGMTPEQSGRLFQAFQQADGSTTRKYGGTGLGLTICKRMVEMMGGTIRVDSEAGRGSTFSFNAWFDLGAERERMQRSINNLRSLHVLVVDDIPTAREVLLAHLANLPQIRAEQAGTAPASIDMARRAAEAGDPYDLVLMDWRLGGADGIEAARTIKAQAPAGRVPAVIMVTAFGREDAREFAEDAELDAFLVKPVNASTLFDTLVRVFAPDVGDAGAAPARRAAPRDLRGMRVLLTEDNEINQQIAVELMESVGVEVEVANNGREALDRILAAEPDRYDVVFMDLQMPVMDGYTATEKIRGEARYDTLPIIAMTAHALVEERERCIAAGMNDHVTKPIDPDNLYATLASWFRRGARSPSSPAAGMDTPATGRAAEEIPAIEGLDTAAGLRRVAGNRSLYLKLLRQFCAGQADAAARVSTAIAAGERAVAERVAHTVKGVAGNIGAVDLQACAGALESALRDGVKPDGQLADFSAALAALVERMTAALPAQSGDMDQVPGAPDVAAAGPVARRVASLLADSDGDVLDAVEQNAALLRPLFAPGRYDAFEKAVNSFDFDAAFAELRVAAHAHQLLIEG